MRNIEDLISPLIQAQFPSFYEEEGPIFIDFVKSYYKWLETENQQLYYSRNLLEYRDIDKTIDAFVVHFKETYLKDIPLGTSVDERFLVKHILDLYQNKGNEQSVKLAMRALFNTAASVYTPGNDILKPSDGIWRLPRYLEVSTSPRNISFVNQQIVGTKTGAVAFCERLVKKRVNGRFIDVLFLSNIQGDFSFREQIVASSNTSTVDAPTVEGSLTTLDVLNGGQNFSVGDEFDVVSTSGRGGKAIVSSIVDATGRVTFVIEDGGFGYTNTATVYISDRVLGLSNVDNTDTSIDTFTFLETVSQNLVSVTYDTAVNSAFFTVNTTIQTANATHTATAGIVSSVISSNTTGVLKVAPLSGNLFATNTTFAAKLFNLTYDSSSNVSLFANGTVIESVNATTTANALIISSATSNTTRGTMLISQISGNVATVNTTFRLATNTATQATINTTASVLQFTSNLSLTAAKTVNTDITATGTLISSGNATVTSGNGYIGVDSVLNAFISNTIFSSIVGATSNTTANVVFVSTGSDAAFNIGSLSDTESVFLATDRLSNRNTGNILFMDINLDLSPNNANAAGYGFAKLPSANVNTVLLDAFFIQTQTIGSISSLKNINPGTDYNIDPYVVVREYNIASQNIPEIDIVYTSANGTYVVGEYVRQVSGLTGVQLTVSDFHGNTANGTVSTTYTTSEQVFQTNGASTFASGFANVASINSTGSGSVLLINTTGTFAPTVSFSFNSNSAVSNTDDFITLTSHTFANNDYLTYYVDTGNTAIGGLTDESSYYVVASNSSGVKLSLTHSGGAIDITAGANQTGHSLKKNIVFGLTSGSKAIVSLVNTSVTINATATGKVINAYPIANVPYLQVRPLSYNSTFGVGNTLIGVTSGATALIGTISANPTAAVMGLNAVISANVQVANATASTLTVIDSGYGYIDDENVSLQAANTPYIVTARSSVLKQGVGEGYFVSTKGFLSNDKKIIDSDYYQEYSYEVQSRVPFSRYADVLKSLLHVAGTKMFGRVVIDSFANSQLTVANSSVEIL